VRPEFLADPVNKQLDAPASGADVYVEVFAIREQLADFTENAPPRPFMELLRADKLQLLIAPRAGHRVHVHKGSVIAIPREETGWLRVRVFAGIHLSEGCL